MLLLLIPNIGSWGGAKPRSIIVPIIKNLPAVVPRKADILNGLDPLVAVYGHIPLSEHHLAG